MRTSSMRVIAAAFAVAAWWGLAPPAAHAAWQSREFESPLGDRATGIAVAADNDPDFVLLIGCDGERGDRWRGATILQSPASKVRLENPAPGPVLRQRVRVALGDAPPVSDTLETRKAPRGGRLYWAPQPSKFAARLLAAEKDHPDSALRVQFKLASGKPLELRFPLAGLGAEFGDLSKRCRDWQP
ncbi:MAG TPA: hypothetical protein VFD92_16850 [Candidatus Binatia bacterium]|nr:hypothetical protein [Candidatus Binatia bacterium]